MAMTDLDARLNAFRTDLAAAVLRDRVSAPRYAEGEPMQVARGCVDLRRAPGHDAPLDSQLLFGEAVTVYDRKDEAGSRWAWVQSEHDGYVGYVEAAALGAPGGDPSHAVNVLWSFLYPEPDLKSPVRDVLSMGALVLAGATRNGFTEVAVPGHGGAWIYSDHLADPENGEADYVATALEFVGLPYLWGGRGSLGLDCSALVQLALNRAGIACPRDSDMQAASIGEPVGRKSRPPRPDYGDLLYMPGHVAIALDETHVVNANAHHMLVSVEPLADVMARVAAESGRPVEKTVDVVRRFGARGHPPPMT